MHNVMEGTANSTDISSAALSSRLLREETKNIPNNIKTRIRVYVDDYKWDNHISASERLQVEEIRKNIDRSSNIGMLRSVFMHKGLQRYMRNIFLSGRLVKDIIESNMGNYNKSMCLKYLNVLANGIERPEHFNSWKRGTLKKLRRRTEPGRRARKSSTGQVSPVQTELPYLKGNSCETPFSQIEQNWSVDQFFSSQNLSEKESEEEPEDPFFGFQVPVRTSNQN